MLKRTVFILLLLVCRCAQASDTDWLWKLGLGPYFAYFGTRVSGSDNHDMQDTRITGVQHWYVASYHEQGIDGWEADTGFYSIDTRAPLPLTMGESKTWTFYMWADPSSSSSGLYLMWGYNYPTPAFDKMEYRLTYVREAEGITEGLAVGTSVLLNDQGQGTWSLPMYRTSDGLTGYMFELTATVIPEPSSLLALGAGVMGLAGLLRKKRMANG